MTNDRISLPDDEVHLWQVRYDQLLEDRLWDRYIDLLDEDETVRRNRFLFERDRRSYAVSHALVRTVLSAYADVPPRQWSFRANAHGRPEIAGPVVEPSLKFNLSHTRGAAIFGVTSGPDVGVDVEALDRNVSHLELADRFFSPAEAADLRNLPETQSRAAFFEYWTLKESYIKARGLGLAIPLDQFTYRLSEGGPISIEFHPRLADDPAAWQFVRWRIDDHFQAAAAVRCDDRRPIRFLLRTVVPLVSVGEPIELYGDDR